MRTYRHLVIPGVSIGIDCSTTSNGLSADPRLAVTLCNEEDNFSRTTARTIIDLLFDAPDETLHALHLKRNVFFIPYYGNSPQVDVIQPLIESMVDNLNERALYRGLRDLFLRGATTRDAARTLGGGIKSDLYRKFEAYTKILEKDDLDMFKHFISLSEFETNFFYWEGSANAIINKIRKFAKNFQPPKKENAAEEKESSNKEETESKETPEELLNDEPKEDEPKATWEIPAKQKESVT